MSGRVRSGTFAPVDAIKGAGSIQLELGRSDQQTLTVEAYPDSELDAGWAVRVQRKGDDPVLVGLVEMLAALKFANYPVVQLVDTEKLMISYDGDEKRIKLLQCSHQIFRHTVKVVDLEAVGWPSVQMFDLNMVDGEPLDLLHRGVLKLSRVDSYPLFVGPEGATSILKELGIRKPPEDRSGLYCELSERSLTLNLKRDLWPQMVKRFIKGGLSHAGTARLRLWLKDGRIRLTHALVCSRLEEGEQDVQQLIRLVFGPLSELKPEHVELDSTVDLLLSARPGKEPAKLWKESCTGLLGGEPLNPEGTRIAVLPKQGEIRIIQEE